MILHKSSNDMMINQLTQFTKNWINAVSSGKYFILSIGGLFHKSIKLFKRIWKKLTNSKSTYRVPRIFFLKALVFLLCFCECKLKFLIYFFIFSYNMDLLISWKYARQVLSNSRQCNSNLVNLIHCQKMKYFRNLVSSATKNIKAFLNQRNSNK